MIMKKLISRHEIKCTLEDVIYESSKILKDKGSFYMVHRSERLVDIIEIMRKIRLNLKCCNWYILMLMIMLI